MAHLILVNEALKDYLVTASPAEKQRLREKLFFLAGGYWEGGVRVKKLKGSRRKVVFEARLDRSRRLLFTLGHDRGESAVHVWGLVEHDDVGPEVRRIEAAAAAGRPAPSQRLAPEQPTRILPANAPFLAGEADETEERTDLSLDEPAEDWYTQEGLEDKAAADYGPQKWMVVGDLEWERLLRTSRPDDIELHLRLTSAQESVLARDPPLLLSGTAGSGKTTISVYYLLRGRAGRKLFVTYSPWLKRYSRGIYDGLRAGQQGGPAEAPALQDGAEFLTLRELLDAILEAAGAPADAAREVALPEFDRIFRSHALYGKYDPQLVWEEIRALIKGAETSLSPRRLGVLADLWRRRSLSPRDLRELNELLFGLQGLSLGTKAEELVTRRSRFAGYGDFVRALASTDGAEQADAAAALDLVVALVEKKGRALERPLLALSDYEALGRRRAPNFPYNREDLHAIAEYYQGRLEAEGLWDEIDLTRRAMAALPAAGERFDYDLVVCDELQDFAEAEISLLFRLARSPRGLVLTGDPRQIINPTGFRWEETRRRFYERGVAVPEVIHLSLNFRCVGSIVSLGNALLELKRRLVGLEGSEVREEWKYEGRPPLLISDQADDAVLAQVDLGAPGRMIVARTAEDQRRLKARLKTDLVFTIAEAKGLEFDTVLLWKPSAGAVDLWRRLAKGQWRERDHAALIRHEINLLYVGVTRARNSLLVYDGSEPCDVWRMPEMQERLFVSREPEALDKAWQVVSTPQDWERQGDYLMEHEQFAAAAECYRHAGAREREQLATARLLLRQRRPAEAAQLFAALGHEREAAESWQAAAAWEQAVELWARLGDDARALVCRAELAESRRDWLRAAEMWQRAGNGERALKAARHGGDHRMLATLFFDQGQYEEALAEWDKAGEPVRAAEALALLGRLDEAAARFYDAGEVARAAEIYRRLRDRQGLLDCSRRLGDHETAAALAEKLRKWDVAEEELRALAAADPAAAARIAAEAEAMSGPRSGERAAVRYAAIGRPGQAAPLFARAKLFDQAVAAYRAAGLVGQAADCLVIADRYGAAVDAIEETQIPDRHIRASQYLGSYVAAARRGPERSARAREVVEQGETFMRAGDCLRALSRFRAVASAQRVFDAYLCLRYDDEALAWFVDAHRYDLAETYLQRREDYRPAPELAARIAAALEAQKSGSIEGRRGRDAFGAALFRRVMLHHGAETVWHTIDSWLRSLPSVSFAHSEMPAGLLDLVLEMPHYGSLARLLDAWRQMDGGLDTPHARRALRRIDEGAQSDPALAACAVLARQRRRFDEALAAVELNLRTAELFALSRHRYRDAVQLLAGAGRAGRAVGVCLRYDDYALAARTSEQAGDLAAAGRYYLQANEPEQALACYERLGSDPGRARALEGMGRLDEALAIQKARHNQRDSERILRKMRERSLRVPPSQPGARDSEGDGGQDDV